MDKDFWDKVNRLEELAGKATQGEWNYCGCEIWANETASKLANFISMLCQQTMGDCEIAPTHLDDKMKRLEEWVTNKAKEGK